MSSMLSRTDSAPDKNESHSTQAGTIIVVFLLVVLLVFLCFSPGLHNDFVYTWDDAVYITGNEHIKSLSFATLSWAFGSVYAFYWAPLTWLSLAVDRAVWGLNPFGYHLSNNILHALNAGMFFLLALQLLQRSMTAGRSTGESIFSSRFNHAFFCSLLAALFFAVHPLRAESVAWATERKDVLSLFFGIPAVLAYLKYTEIDGNRPAALSFASSSLYWSSVALFCLSLLSKSTLVTLPLVLLVLDWFPLDRARGTRLKKLLLEKTVFLLISGAVAVIILSTHQSASMPFTESGLDSRALIAFRSIMYYLWFMIWPFHLSPFYLHPGNVSVLSIEYAVPVLFFLIVSICAALLVKRTPALIAVWLIYAITLLPLLGFVQVSNTIMSDRFTYIPSMPVSILVALSITQLLIRLSGARSGAPSDRSRGMPRRGITVGVLLSAVAFIFMINAYLTVRQLSFWKNDVTLWSRAIDVNPHFSGRTYYMRAISYKMKGEYEKALTDMDEAIAIAERKKRPQMHDLYAERASIFARLGNYRCAIADYTKALQSDFSAQRSVYYRERGQVYKEQGMLSLANEDFRSAASISGK